MSIPCLDLNDFVNGNESQKKIFVTQLGQSFENIGFVAIKNHGLQQNISDSLYQKLAQFFALSDAEKAKYEIEGIFGQRGYTGKKKENAKGRNIGDLKEFFHFGQTNIPYEKELAIHYPENVQVAEIPDLMAIGNQIFETLETAGIAILRAIALHLQLNENYFDQKVATGNSILRAIHYFPIQADADLQNDAVRAAAHEDINLITLLMGASADGLQILRKDGNWEAVTALPDQIVVNVGDMLARLTNDKLISTTHRVINPEKHFLHLPRYSLPFFMHPRADVNLACLENCISLEHPKKYEDINAGQFLDQRLKEIGLKK